MITAAVPRQSRRRRASGHKQLNAVDAEVLPEEELRLSQSLSIGQAPARRRENFDSVRQARRRGEGLGVGRGPITLTFAAPMLLHRCR